MSEDLKKHIGDILKEARLKQKISQQSLAQIVGLSVTTIRTIEKGCGNPYWKNYAVIIDTLGVPYDFKFEKGS